MAMNAALPVALCLTLLACQTVESPVVESGVHLPAPAYRMRPLQLSHADGSRTALRIWSPGDRMRPVADVFIVTDVGQRPSDVPSKESPSRQLMEYLSMRWAIAGLRVIDFDFPLQVTEEQRFVLAADVLRRTSEDPDRQVIIVGAGTGAILAARILADTKNGMLDGVSRPRGLLLFDPPNLDDLQIPREFPLFIAIDSGLKESVSDAAEKAFVRFFEDDFRGGGILLCPSFFKSVTVVSPLLTLSTQEFLLNPSGFDGDGTPRADVHQNCELLQHPLR
jgi:hypothetical protein